MKTLSLLALLLPLSLAHANTVDRVYRPNGNAAGVSCSEVIQEVTGALAACWNQVNRGCTTSVGQQYAYALAQAGRADYSCASRIEIACRQECYPRFPTDCNRSCATLASYAR